MIGATLLTATGLVLVHLFASKMRFLSGIPRSWWLSLAGGVSVAYVFLHLLPELGAGQEKITRALGGLLGFTEHHVYLVALVGLAIFYGLERLARTSRRQKRQASEEDRTSAAVFQIHITSFTIYNALIGYLLLHLEERTLQSLALFSFAMALHFVVNDFGLQEAHKSAYHQLGRWVLAAAVLSGWAVGYLVEIPDVAIAVLIAFLAGGVILNVLKEELPEERQSRFLPFALGTVGYAAILLAV